MVSPRISGFLAMVWATVAPCVATASDIVVPIGPDLTALGWRDMPFKNKTPNRHVGHVDGRLEVLTERSVSLLFHPIQVDLARTPCLTWRWRVDRTMEPTDLTRKDVDDRPLAVYVAFPHVASEASLGERLKRVLVEQIEGPDTPDRVLIYMWGGLGARGSWFLSPHIGEAGPMRILRPGDSALGVWQAEHVDVEADYRRAFGKAPPPTQYVAVAGDSDDTRSASAATIADLTFRETCP